MMEDAIFYLVQDFDLRQQSGEMARRHAARLDVRKTAGRIEDVYTELFA